MASVASKRIRLRVASETKISFRMAVPSVVVCAVPTHSPEGSRSRIFYLQIRNSAIKSILFFLQVLRYLPKDFSKIPSCQTQFFIPNSCQFVAPSAAHCLPKFAIEELNRQIQEADMSIHRADEHIKAMDTEIDEIYIKAMYPFGKPMLQ